MMTQISGDQAYTLTMERISVLLDGEMNRADAATLISQLCSDPRLRRHWHELHRAGDALRSEEVAACDAESFCARVAAAIAGEPTVIAPRALRTSSGLRRYWMPGVAVAASAAVVAFVAVPLLRAPDTATVATTSASSAVGKVEVASQKPLPTIATARGLNASFTPYLAAHRELIGNSVVPRATVYLRSAEDR